MKNKSKKTGGFNLSNFLLNGISYDKEYEKLTNDGLQTLMLLGGGEISPAIELKIFSMASETAKLLITTLRSKNKTKMYYSMVESFDIIQKEPSELAVSLVQELSTLPESVTKEFNLENILHISLNLLTKLTNQDYLSNFKRLVALGKTHEKDTYVC